jgi:hypothetical protein
MRNLQRKKTFLLILFLLRFSFLAGRKVLAISQTTDFIYVDGLWYDSWGYTRNYAVGSNGFIPNVAYEALGEWQGIAYSWGKQFEVRYPEEIRRAEEILRFVQQWTEYGYDEDNVVIGGRFQEEWAWNGDEMASKIDFDSNTPAIGDCEDLAFLCSAIYEGAGFDTAMILTTRHVALLLWLPDYPNVLKWDIVGDGRGYGWIWVEATGENNPLGWTPDIYRDGDWEAFVIELLYIHDVQYFPREPNSEDAVTITASILNKTSNIDEIVLRYLVEGMGHEVAMNPIDTIRYQAVIPKQKEGSYIAFEIYVADHIENKRYTERFSYQVGNRGFSLPPFLFNTGFILIIFAAMIILFIAL